MGSCCQRRGATRAEQAAARAGGERQACGWAVQSWAKRTPARAALAGRAGGAGLAEALGRSGLGWGLAAWAGLVFYLTGFFSFYFSLSNSNSNKAI